MWFDEIIFGYLNLSTDYETKIFNSDNFIIFLQKEMLINQNSIINESVMNDKIIKNFEKRAKFEKINVFIEQKDEDKFSIFIKNSSSENLVLVPQDNSLYLIQEAVDEKGKWKPIEF